MLTDIHAKGNGRVDAKAAAAFRRELEARGIPALAPGEVFSRAKGVLALLGQWGGTGTNLGFDEDDDLDDSAEVDDAA